MMNEKTLYELMQESYTEVRENGETVRITESGAVLRQYSYLMADGTICAAWGRGPYEAARAAKYGYAA